MAAVKPDKIREEFYDFVVAGLEGQGFTPVGRSKEGLVFENHIDGEHVVVKVIKKKNQVSENELAPVTTYEEKSLNMRLIKPRRSKEKEDEDEEEGEAGFEAA